MKLRSRLRGLSLCICLGSIFAQTAMPPITGAGTASEPYQIATLENLYWIGTTDSTVTPDLSTRLLAHYIQVADINASSTSTWNYDGAGTYEGWAPIGASFSGYYDGGGHIIDSLYIYRPSQNYQSLFGSSYMAEIKNLGLINVNITGNDNTGGICGYLRYTDIINCFVSGTLSGNNYTGGLLGYADGCIIDRCYNKASVLQASGDAVGGLTGYNKSCAVGNCYNIGDVNGIYNVGGLVGYNRSGSVSKCYNSGTIFGLSNSGALLGFNLGGVVSDSFWDVDSSGVTFIFLGTALSSAEMKNDSNFINAGWDFVGESVNGEDDIWNIDSNINKGYPYLENHLLVIRDLTISGGGDQATFFL